MLKISVHDEPATRRLQVEGKLTGVSIAELENTWRSERQSAGAKPVEIDLTGMTAIDQGGKCLLSLLYKDGAYLVAAGAKAKELMGEIANGARIESASDSRGRRCWKVISLSAADSISNPIQRWSKEPPC